MYTARMMEMQEASDKAITELREQLMVKFNSVGDGVDKDQVVVLCVLC